MQPGQFKLVRRHKSGAYGEVWQAEQVDLKRQVALKVIKVEWADTAPAKAHAMALASLNHPNIVTVHSLAEVEIDGQPSEAIVMEWLEGETYGDRLSRGALTKVELVHIMRCQIHAIRHMHANSVYHGDLHAGNVIIGDSFVKVIDISASDPSSVARFSTISRETLIAKDVASLAYNLRFGIYRCTTDFDPLCEEINKLASARSIEEVEVVLNALDAFDGAINEEYDEDDDDERYLDQFDLGELDEKVFKYIGDAVIKGEDVSDPIGIDDLLKQLSKEDIEENDILDSIEILEDRHFFRESTARYHRYAQISVYGLNAYLNAFYPDYNETFKAVKFAIVKDKVTLDKNIAKHLQKPLPIVQHCLDLLEQEYGCSVSRHNMGWDVVTVSAKLRREVK